MKKSILLMILMVLALSFTAASAATNYRYWDCDGSTDWFDPNNWDKPYSTEVGYVNTAIIKSSDCDPVLPTGVTTEVYREVRFGYNDGGDGSGLTVTGGTLLVDRLYTANGYLNIGTENGGTAYLDISAGHIWAMQMGCPGRGYAEGYISGGTLHLDRIRMGHGAGHSGGFINMTGGTLAMTDNPAYTQYITIGYQTGGYTAFNLSGGTINLNTITIAWYEDGEFNINGGTINATNDPDKSCYIRISANSDSMDGDGTLNMTAGTVTVNGSGLIVGHSGPGSATMNMSGGDLYCTNLYVGYTDPEGGDDCVTDPTLNMSGGTIEVNYDNSGGFLSMKTADGLNPIIDMSGGEIVWNNYPLNGTIEGYIASGNIIAYSGSGRAKFDGVDTITADDTAHTPNPWLDEDFVSVLPGLVSWVNPFEGQSVGVSVWLDTDPAMATATNVATGTDITSASLSLLPNTTYYWRVDTTSPTATTGEVWSFTTSPEGAYNHVPTSGTPDILKAQVLSWDMAGDYDTVDIYIGETEAGMILVNSQGASDTDYHYGALEYGKQYFWRVDGVKNSVATTGITVDFTMVDPQCSIDETQGDLNGDCVVDLNDFATISTGWMDCGWSIPEACE